MNRCYLYNQYQICCGVSAGHFIHVVMVMVPCIVPKCSLQFDSLCHFFDHFFGQAIILEDYSPHSSRFGTCFFFMFDPYVILHQFTSLPSRISDLSVLAMYSSQPTMAKKVRYATFCNSHQSICLIYSNLTISFSYLSPNLMMLHPILKQPVWTSWIFTNGEPERNLTSPKSSKASKMNKLRSRSQKRIFTKKRIGDY